MIGFNGGLIGSARDEQAFPSKPGIWTPQEHVIQERLQQWTGGWWVQRFSNAATAAASSGSIPNSGTPFWVDINPVGADLDYDSAEGITKALDGSLTTNCYWVGNEYGIGNVLRARLDLRFVPVVITSIRIYGTDLAFTSYSVQLLDSSKNAIAGTSRSIDGNTATWHSMTIAGSPAFLEFSCTTGAGRRLRLYAIEINGKILLNDPTL